VIIEVPWVVVDGAAAPVVSSYGWVDPGYYPDNSASTPWREPNQIAPFDPTPREVVERMLALGGVQKGDVVYDLGAGDGRVVIAAAKKYGVRAVGFEIDAGLAKLARENVRKEGVENLVEIREGDFLGADLSPATVVTLYLSYDGNLAVRPRLMTQLKPGARIVSYTFDMGDWQPKIAEAYRDAAGEQHLLYLWEIGGPLLFSDTRR
jgi:SAM-dependent methyltransferase